MKCVFFTALLWLGLASQVFAQEKGTPSLKDEAQAIIDSAGAQAYFVALDHPTMRRVRHTPSGLVCSFQRGSNATIQVFAGSGAAGEDVACIEDQSSSQMSLFATRLQGATAERWFKSADRSLHQWPWRTLSTPMPNPLALDSSPDDSTLRITYDRRRALYFGVLNDSITLARIAVADVGGGWFVKQRFLAPMGAPDPETLSRAAAEFDYIGEGVFASVLGQIKNPELTERIARAAFEDPAKAATPINP